MKIVIEKLKVAPLLFFLALFFHYASAGVIADAPWIKDAALNALEFLLSIAGVLAIISMVVSGAIYFFSAGSPQIAEKAKKGFGFSIIGTIAIFGALIIVKTAQKLVE